MKRICPNPIPWNRVFERLTLHARSHDCVPPSPPTPLILAGWAYSNDIEKLQRWHETIAWAKSNECMEIVSNLPDSDFYFTDAPSTHVVGPLGGPMYRPWDYDSKTRPSSENLLHFLEALKSAWSETVGDELGRVTRPLMFAGAKARRLIVYADTNTRPPWGNWNYLSAVESERRKFTQFRAAINNVIVPHEIDHVDFTTEPKGEFDAR